MGERAGDSIKGHFPDERAMLLRNGKGASMYWVVLAHVIALASALVPVIVAALCRDFAENACRGGNQARAQALIARCVVLLELPPWGWSRYFARLRSNHCARVGLLMVSQGWDAAAEELFRRSVNEGRRGHAYCQRDLSYCLFHLGDFLAESGRTSEALVLFDEIHELHGDVIPLEHDLYHLARSYRDTLRGRRERGSIRRIFDRRRQSGHASSGQGGGPTP